MYLNFHCWKSSQKKWQTSQLSRIYQTLTWRQEIWSKTWSLPNYPGELTALLLATKKRHYLKLRNALPLNFYLSNSPPHFFYFPFPVFSFCWTFTRVHFVGKIFWKHQDHSLLSFLHGIFSMLLTWFLNFSFAHFTESHLFGHGLKDFFYLHKLGV